MSDKLEHLELLKFYHSLVQDIKSLQLSEDEGGNLEQIFTRTALDLLTDGGETENARDAYDEGQLGTKNQHKINAYAEPDNYETVDLFITIFKGTDEPQRIPKEEIDTAVKRISNFFRKAKYKEYVNEIEESSPIFDFAHTLANSEVLGTNLVRVNAIILTDGLYPGESPETQTISGTPVFYRIVDINYLYNITEKSHIPIEIDFQKEGFEVPCILSPSENDEYQSYLAIIPGSALATIYERYGSRLLEQNVRSFLQFTGKINKGIRTTILKEPHMFLAFNNGIAATAEELEISKSENGKGLLISKVKDFQIVNGGQTTASIYHTLKKDKADISGIFVQVKLSVVKNRDKFSEIVSRISEYANTQNKVSVSDLSSNRPYHIELEKISRNIFAPHVLGQSSQQTKWFYERARGQYKNARAKEGFTKAKQKAFDLKNPKSQMFSKEDLAKYVNAYKEEYDGKKLVVGPHWVVKGNQKNYAQFIGFNLEKKIDSIYFEDLISKAILFKSAEKIYGVKPNSIGDMRYITVPYAISYFGYKTDYKLDLYKIWRNQGLSESLKKLLFDLMKEINSFIKTNAPSALYGEWAKKEECWNELKKKKLDIDFKTIKSDLEDPKNPSQRKRVADEETILIQMEEELETIKSIPPEIWHKIEDWGRTTEKLSEQKKTVAYNIAGRIRNNTKISDYERQMAIVIIEEVIKNIPELLEGIDEINDNKKNIKLEKPDITIELISKIVQWDKKYKKLRVSDFVFMSELAKGNKPLTDRNKSFALSNLAKIKKLGFAE
jgi:hypothetical protein